MSESFAKNLNLEERSILARTLVVLLDEWQVSATDQIKILGLPDETRVRTLRGFHHHTPLPDDKQTLDRAEFLLAIADALRTAYPRNPHMGAQWMNRRHRRFRRRTAVATMVEDGMLGLMSIRAELDCTYSWDQTGSKP